MPTTSTSTSPATGSYESETGKTITDKGRLRLYFGYGSNLWREQMKLRCPSSRFLGIARLRGYRWMINERGYANVASVAGVVSDSEPVITSVGSGDSVGDGEDGGEGEKPTDGDKWGDDEERGDKRGGEGEGEEHVVWGAVYSLTPQDEAYLDINEGVPYAYEKRDIDGIEFWPQTAEIPLSTGTGSGTDPSKAREKDMNKAQYRVRDTEPEIVSMLVYIDFLRMNGDGSEPREEYIHRMNMGIYDALEVGMPGDYVDSVLRRWIPEEEEEEEHRDGDEKEGTGTGKGRETGVNTKAKARELALSQARAFKDESGIIPVPFAVDGNGNGSGSVSGRE